MSSEAKLFFDIIQQHYKGLAGIGAIDAIFISLLGFAYISKGDIQYMQWVDIFTKEAYGSMGIVILVSVIVFLAFRNRAKARIEYVS